MNEQNNKISDIVFFNADGEYVYGDSQDGIDASIAKMRDVVAKAIKCSPYVANMYKNGWGMVSSLANRCPTFQELNFSDNTSVTLYEPNNYETGNTFYFNGQPTQLAKLFIKKVDLSFNIDNDNSTSDYANKNLVCLDDIKCEYTSKIITLVFNDMSIDETYINRTFIFEVDSQIEDAQGFYNDPNRKYDYCTFDAISTRTSTDGNYMSWYSFIHNKDLVQPVELVSYANMGNPRTLTVKLNYGNTLRIYFNGVDLYNIFKIKDDNNNLISFNVNNHSYYKQYSYKINGGNSENVKVTSNFDIQLDNVSDDTTIDIYGYYKDTCDIKINTVGDCSVYDTYEEQTITEYNTSNGYSEEHYQTFTNIMSPGYNYYIHKTHYNACDVSYDSSNKAICKIGQTFYVSVDENVYNKFYWKFTGIKTEPDGTTKTVVFDSIDYAMNVYGYTTKEDVLKNGLNVIKLQSGATAEEFKTIRMKDNDYYGFFVPMDLKQHYINVNPSNPMTDESTNPMYPLNKFSIRNLYIEVTEKYKSKTVTFYIYDDMDVKMMNADSTVSVIYGKGDSTKFPYKKVITTNDGDYYVGDNKYNGDNMRITCDNATDTKANNWYFITDNNIGNKSEVRRLGEYAIINAYDNMTVHLSLSKSVVAYMYITADSTISVYDIYREMVVPTDGVTVHTTDTTPNSPHMLQAYFKVSSSDLTANVITVEKRFFYVEDGMVAEDLSERSRVQISISDGTLQYTGMRTDGYYKISFKNTIRYESKNADVMVMYSDGRNIIPKINELGTVNYTVNNGNTVFKFKDLTDTTNTYTLSLVLSNETKKRYPSATVRYKQRITASDIVDWKTASNIMTSDNSYTIQIGGDAEFGKAKLLDILITPQEAIRYSVKIVNTGQLCKVFSWDYVKEEYMSLGDKLNITLTTSYDNPNKFKVKFDVKDKETYNFYTLLYVSPSGLIEHEPNIKKFNDGGYAVYEDSFVAANGYELTITPIIGNIVYLTFPNDSTLNVTTTALKISNGSNESIIYEKYALDNDKVTFTINGLPESVISVNLYMYGSDTDDINANTWLLSGIKNGYSVVNGSVSFDYKYKCGFYNDDGSVGTENMIYKYYKIDVRPISQSDYVFAVDTAEPCPALRGQSWNIYITKTAPNGVKTSISYSDISLGENPTFKLKDTSTVDTTIHSKFSDYFYVVGTIFNVENLKIRIILAPKLTLEKFIVGTDSTGTKRYLKTGDVIENLIKINANDSNYSPSNIYVDCVIGQVITLEWAEATTNAMVNGKINVKAPWTSTSNKPLYFNCIDSSGNIINVNVNNNFVDVTSSFAKSTISSTSGDPSTLLPLFTGTHTLNLKSKSSVSIGEYKIGIKYHEDKQISAIIKISSAESNIRFWPYTVNESAVNKGYILSTATLIKEKDGYKIIQMISLGGTEWLSVRYTAGSTTPYKFIDGLVYNEDGETYTNISNEPTSKRNLQWGAKLYVLVYLNSTFSLVGEGFVFADSWKHLFTDKT